MAAAKAQQQFGIVIVPDRPEEVRVWQGWGRIGRLGGGERGGERGEEKGGEKGRDAAGHAGQVPGAPHRPSSWIFIERCRCT